MAAHEVYIFFSGSWRKLMKVWSYA